MFDEERKRQLIAAVRAAAREHVLPRFRALMPGDVRTKSGPSDLVTLADIEAEAAITRAMNHAWPEAEVIGEEAVAADRSLRARMGQAEWSVILDPVDGTWNFAKGLAVFGMMVAVLRGNRPVWGMLYDPLMDDWIEAGVDMPTQLIRGDGRVAPLAASPEERPGRMTGYVPTGLFRREDQLRLAQELIGFARITSLRCACHEYRMVAQGHVEFCLSGPTPHPWDHAAGVLCVEQAGGVARFLDGGIYEARRTRGIILAAGSEKSWESLARRFAWLA